METVVARCDQGSGNAAVPNGYRQEDAKASPEEERRVKTPTAWESRSAGGRESVVVVGP